jgi:DNA-directed RNA polymerase subunit beta
MRSIRFHQDIFLAEMPLMTDEGTFLVNGCERIVISQIIRSPGIYFRKEFGKSSKKTKYTATIISNKGLWTKFFLDNEVIDEGKQDRVYVKLSEFKRKRTLSPIERKIHKLEEIGDESRLLVFDFLKYFGFTFQEIIDTVKYPQFFPTQQLAPQTLLEREFKPHEKVKVRRYTVHEYERDDWETVRLIENLFANRRSGCFSLGEIGRYKVNQSLQLHLPKQVTYLTAHDFIGILNGLIELKYFDRPNDDIDDIRNKLVRSVGELLQLQLRIGIVKLKQKLGQGRRYPAGKVEGPKTVREEELREEFADIPEMGNNDWLLDPRPVTSILRDFFKTSQLSQYMDQINPLAEITHKRRISVFGPNGLKRDHVSIVIRDIHPSQYGRLCPIETPEGQNAGLINTLALYGRVDALGSLETPYFLLENGKIASTKQPIFLNPHQEFQTRVAFGDVSTSESKILEKPYLSVKENYFFSQQKTADIPFLTLSPLQIVSVATALIPFLEHNDANRALMGSNMQRQAVPLLYPQKPIVGTGFEAVIPLDSGFVIKTYCQGEVFTSSARRIQIKDKADQIITYRLRKYSRSNQETAINQRPVVWPGEKVYSNQIIADGPSTVDGELSLGHNLVIAYMPWEGYNYEDAIVINERVLVEDCLKLYTQILLKLLNIIVILH